MTIEMETVRGEHRGIFSTERAVQAATADPLLLSVFRRRLLCGRHPVVKCPVSAHRVSRTEKEYAIMKTRPSFECCQCRRTFGQVVDLEGHPVLLVECPYCGAECKVDMAPYRQRVVIVTRGEHTGSGAAYHDLPGTVPTSRPGDDDPEQAS